MQVGLRRRLFKGWYFRERDSIASPQSGAQCNIAFKSLGMGQQGMNNEKSAQRPSEDRCSLGVDVHHSADTRFDLCLDVLQKVIVASECRVWPKIHDDFLLFRCHIGCVEVKGAISAVRPRCGLYANHHRCFDLTGLRFIVHSFRKCAEEQVSIQNV